MSIVGKVLETLGNDENEHVRNAVIQLRTLNLKSILEVKIGLELFAGLSASEASNKVQGIFWGVVCV